MRRRVLATLAVALTFVLFTSRAGAQLHGDASAQIGGEKRFLVDRPTGGPNASFGPVGQLTGHVALLPLVRLGAYFGHDISPFGGEGSATPPAGAPSARDITWGGLRAKIMSPWPHGDARLWLFFGFGYAGVYQRSASLNVSVPGPPGMPPVSAQRVMHGAGGGFFEVPFGIGASYKLRKPWELCAELGGRAGFAHTGSVYGAPGPRTTGPEGEGHAPPAGTDRFGIGLTIGVLIDL